jgi:membrane-associated protease RseP (regulator of RpoE activity)
MTPLLFLLGVLVFAVGVALSIGLHELGHLVPGKLFGVKVTQYFVGFGPTVWSRRRGETEYGVKAVPFGGYVKLVGMLPPGDEGDPSRLRRSNTGIVSQLIRDARSAEYDLVEEGDEDRLFYRLSWWRKLVVMGSGVATNLVIAFLLFCLLFIGRGVPEATTTVADVSRCVVATSSASTQQRSCTAADPASPARRAGIRPGDRVVSFNGAAIHGWRDLARAIRSNENGAASIVVRRDGRPVTLHTNTTVTVRPDPNDPQRTTRTGFLGIVPATHYVRQGPGFVVRTMATGTWQTVQAIGALPVKLYHVGRAALGLEARDPNGPMSVVGAGRIAGEVTAQAPTIGDGLFFVVGLLAGLNLFLAMLNLVPLLPLDGGQMAGAVYEAVRRGLARLLHRPDPGFVDVAKLLPVGYVMAGVILVASVVLIYADIVAPVSLG